MTPPHPQFPPHPHPPFFLFVARRRTHIELRLFLLLPLVLPPTVVGFLLLVLFGRTSWPGRAFERIFHHPLFSWEAAVVAAVFVSACLSNIKGRISRRGQGSGRCGKILLGKRMECICEGHRASILAVLCSWIGQRFGRIRGDRDVRREYPQIIPAAIYTAVDSGNWTAAWLWGGTMVILSFLLMW